jgi:hypothetical protein
MWWAAVDSNHLPPRYQHGALPVELAAQRAREEPTPDHRSLLGRLILQRDLKIKLASPISEPASRRRDERRIQVRSSSAASRLRPCRAAPRSRRHPFR